MSDNIKTDDNEAESEKNSSPLEIGSHAATEGWAGSFPGPADKSFDYRRLLDNSKNGIANASGKDLKVAVIGAGPAGLTAAHELVRSGVKTVHLFEASDRSGGRFWTKTVEAAKGVPQISAMDAGAMRMPPFIHYGKGEEPAARKTEERQEQVWGGKSVLSYYLNKYKISTDEFPNPGSEWADTGIYYNEGSLTPQDADYKNLEAVSDQQKSETVDASDYEKRNADETATGNMLIWRKGLASPPNNELREVQRKWKAFGNKFKDLVKKHYSTKNWPTVWQNIVKAYYDKTFRDVVFLDPETDEQKTANGDFGGMGMSEKEARIFYVIGAGDGGWGSFFNLSFLYVYRTFVHGFSEDLQVIEGLFDQNGKRRTGFKEGRFCRDSLGSQIRTPEYLGTSTITDCLLFQPLAVDGTGDTLYESQEVKPDVTDGFKMYFNSPICEIEKRENGKVRLHVKTPGDTNVGLGIDKNYSHDFGSVDYDAAFITVPTHQFGTEIKVTGFDAEKEWPYDLQAYLSQAHWEPCSKVFVELTEPYWESKDCNIPQIIASETAIRDTYGVKLDVKNQGDQNGILLLSYTWWRDATKLVSYSDQELINLAVKEADRMLANCQNMSKDDRISEYVKFTKDEFGNKNYKGWVHHWELQKHYKGAARLYDQRTWNNTQVPMMYNQKYSKVSNLYFAGEGYHVDAGWVEPAFRTAIDAVLRFFVNNGIKIITEEFEYKYFPQYDESFDPMKDSNLKDLEFKQDEDI